MTSDTSTSLGTNTSGTKNSTNEHYEEQEHESPSQHLPSKKYLCTSCQISFQDGQAQRNHMKAPWHVYNIKRRIASLPPTPRDVFEAQIETKGESNPKPVSASASSSTSSDEEGTSETELLHVASPYLCLFCPETFTPSLEGFHSNLSHMDVVHGMSIPSPENVSDLQSLIGYLATEVRAWHECLYCGATKGSAESTQSHMRDKRHCRLNLEREPELKDFWDSSLASSSGEEEGEGEEVEEKGRRNWNLDDGEMRLPDGRVIASRQAAPEIKKTVRKQRALAASAVYALPPGAEGQVSSSSHRSPSPSTQLTHRDISRDLANHFEVPPSPPAATLPSRQQLSRRDEMSITGLSPQQQRALVLAEKKAQRSEAVARRARDWAYAQGRNSQKFDQIDAGKGKWGKQNHKLLPR